MSLSRSEQMARIRGRNTKPELLMKKALSFAGVRARRQVKIMSIRPDFVIHSDHVAIFVDGCQWHGCPEHYVRPRTNHGFWASKLLENVQRDIRQTALLEASGWRVVRVWEHQLEDDRLGVVKNVLKARDAHRWRPTATYRAIEVLPINRQPGIERWSLVDLRGKAPPLTELRRRAAPEYGGHERKAH
jgi:DNA mismatch endonuclease, patch repair protein